MTEATMVAIALCGLVTGFLLAFAVVVMPGLRQLDDGAYLRAFQVIDGVIQRRQPLFLLLWVGALLAVAVVMGLAVRFHVGTERLLAVAAGVLYLGGVQLLTMIVHLPLNAMVQRIDPAATATTLREARTTFEARWTRWNAVRVGFGMATVILLLALLARL
ncbi:MAG TPA: DUF1772 domain-containing protein [Gemmatimonadales bacterium]|nr:DUF1772 domain-containing protein [Gemmatimonadales bacterium]HPF62095.1 DUF1772 domain-containing protein [Gemmatimonadales bacterium]